MDEARAPKYTDVPCRGASCSANIGQPCTGLSSMGSHRVRRQLWEAMAQAQDRGQNVVLWYGLNIQVRVRLR